MVWLWSLTKEMLLLVRKENQENCGIFLSLKWNLIFSQWSKCIVLPYTEGGQWGSGQIAKSKSREWFCYYLDRMMNRSCCIVCLLSVTLIPHLLMGGVMLTGIKFCNLQKKVKEKAKNVTHATIIPGVNMPQSSPLWILWERRFFLPLNCMLRELYGPMA